MKKHILGCLGALALVYADSYIALAQKPAKQTTTLTAQSQIIPLDPSVKVGKLANGFTYYIKKNTEPKKRAQLYLALKAGSILETEEQRGLAHFMEHMSFNGTKNFPKNELVDYLQKSGVRFGADLNAYTGFDETVYQLPIPTDDPVLFNNGMKIMRDWAQNALLETSEIDKERGVILEEKRLGKGAMERMREKFLPVLVNHSRYAQRIPIGTDAVLNSFKPETLRSFYSTWYRPNLQALVVVGDIDVAKVEAQIKALFSDLKNPANAPARTKYNIPLEGKNQFIAVSDKELPYTVVQIFFKAPALEIKTRSDLKKNLVNNLFNAMIAARFGEISKQADPPFLQAGFNISEIIANIGGATALAVPKAGQFERGVKAMFTEVERVKKFGFTQGELDRAKQDVLSAMEVQYNERDKTTSVKYVNEYIQHFLKGEASPGIEYEYKFAKEVIPGINIQEINDIISKVITEKNRDVIVLCPDKELASVPSENTFNQWFTQVQQSPIKAYEDNVSNKPLLAANLTGSKTVSEKTVPQIGVTELTLANGIRIVLKPTTFKNDQIIFYGSSRGGSSVYPDTDYLSASSASSLVPASGVGEFTAIQLPKMLSGKVANVKPFIGSLYEGFQGSASPKDLETAFQLMYLYATQPRLDNDIFQSNISSYKDILKNRGNDPNAVFADTVSAVLGGYNLRAKSLTPEQVDLINREKTLSVYKDRFSDFSDYVFVFVGNFKVENIKPLLEKYLGSLPSTGRKESFVDRNIYPLKGKVVKVVNRGKEDKALIKIVFSGEFDYSEQNAGQMNAVAEVLGIKLTQRLREEESGVYSPNAGVSVSRHPKGYYQLTVNFGCAPANADNLIHSTLDEIEKLRKNGATPVDVEKYKAETKRQLEVAEKNNGFWQARLNTIYTEGQDPLSLTRLDEMYKNVTTESVKQFANKYLDGSNIIVFKLLPETK